MDLIKTTTEMLEEGENKDTGKIETTKTVHEQNCTIKT